MKKIKNEQLSPDIVLKKYWEDRAHFSDLFNTVFFPGKEVVREKQLRNTDPTVSNRVAGHDGRDFVRRMRDVVMQFHPSGVAMAVLGIENQENVHYAMPLRMLLYDALSYQKQYDKIAGVHKRKNDLTAEEYLSRMKKTDRLYPVISIVIYYGEKPWDGAKSIKEMLYIPEEFKALVNDYPINLIEVRKSGLDFQNKDNRDMFRLLEILYDQTLTVKECEEQALLYYEKNQVDSEVLMSVVAAAQYHTPVKNVWNSLLMKEGEEAASMCRVFDAIYDEGVVEGKMRGRAEGREEGREEGRAEGLRDGQAKQIIRLSRKHKVSESGILDELVEALSLTQEQAREYMQRFAVQ